MTSRRIFTTVLSILAAGAILVPAVPSLADDESDEVQIEIKAPLDAVACDTTPQTLTVLGLPIDVTNAQFDVESEDDSEDESASVSGASQSESEDDQGEDQGDDEGEDDGENGDVPATCADLLVGRTVEVKLTGDIAPLVATKVEQEDDGDEIEIQAPIQAVDPVLQTLTLLGLPIDISMASVEGCDDEDEEGANEGIDPSTLMVGQFVEVKLDPNALPALVASELEVKNFSNTVEIDIEDALGNDIDDVDDDGQPVPTVTIDVTQIVPAAVSQSSSTGSKGPKASKGSGRTLRFQARSNGRVVLHGLPTGNAAISVIRSAQGLTSRGRGSALVAPDTTTSTVIRLKGSKSKSKSK